MTMSRTPSPLRATIKFVADEKTAQRLALGASIDWTTFTDAKFGMAGTRFVPAGTVVEIGANGLAPADGTGAAYLTAGDLVENPTFKIGGDNSTGLYAGGVFFENFLPDADTITGLLPDALKTELGAKFTFQQHPTRFIPS
jgi:hypothetical protein